MKLALVIPIWQRPTLTNHLLTWYHTLVVPGHEITVIVAGSEGESSRRIARGLDYVEVPNQPIDRKYDLAIGAARAGNPDAVCLIGSDDILTAEYFRWGCDQLQLGGDLVGLLDFYLVDLPARKILYWGGYTGLRQGNLIGAGRIYGRYLLDRIDWRPYWSPSGYRHTDQDDERAMKRVLAVGGHVQSTNMAHIGCQYWAIKTGQEWNPVRYFQADRLVDITPSTWPLYQRTVQYAP